MAISSRHYRIRRGFPVIRACTARLPRLLRSLAMTSLGACFLRRSAMTSLRVPSSRVIARRAKPDVAISSRHYRIRRGFPVFRACTARLPRLLRSLAMTSLGACFLRRSAMTSLRVPSSRVIARRAKPDVAISSRHYRIRRGFPVFRACTARLPRLLRSLAMTSRGGFPHPEGRNDKPESLLLALITSRTRQNRNQPLEIATFPNQQTDPPIQDSSSLSAHLSVCGTSL